MFSSHNFELCEITVLEPQHLNFPEVFWNPLRFLKGTNCCSVRLDDAAANGEAALNGTEQVLPINHEQHGGYQRDIISFD